MEEPVSDLNSISSAPHPLRSSAPLLAFILLALGLRLWGITWALPNQQHILSYHPDEGLNLLSGVMERARDEQGRTTLVPRPHLDLHFYNYGGLYFYVWQGAVAINRTYGFVKLPPTGTPNSPSPESFAAMILVGRLLTAALGALTVWPVFALGNRLFGRGAGLLAGAIYALIPAAVIHGHYATVDVPATFFIAVALALGARLLTSTHPKDCALAGLFCGLAAATKYNAALVLFAPLAALLLQRGLGRRVGWQAPALVVGAAILGFLLGCPGALIEPGKFASDFGYEWRKSGQGMGLLFAGIGNGWLYHLTSSLRFGLGWALLLFCLAALVLALARRTRQDWYLLSFLLPYYLVIGYAQVRYLRYVIPLFPVLAVFAGRLLSETWPERPAMRRIVLAAGALAGIVTLLLTLALDRLMTLPDARDQAYDYIQANVPPGKTIAFATTPWYYTPPLSPLFTVVVPQARREAAAAVTQWRLRVPPDGEWDLRVFDPPVPDYALLSDIESEDAIRLGLADTRRFIERLNTEYTAHVFQNTPSIFGLDFGKPDYVPNDWLYIYPRITLYTRK